MHAKLRGLRLTALRTLHSQPLTSPSPSQVHDMVGPILADLLRQQPLLEDLRIDVFECGTNAPRFGGFKVYDTRDDEVILEAPLQFGSKMKARVRGWALGAGGERSGLRARRAVVACAGASRASKRAPLAAS